MFNNLGKEFNETVKSRQKAELLTSLMKYSQSLSPAEFDEFINKLRELSEACQQLESSHARSKRSDNILAGLGIGMWIGAFIALALIILSPGKPKTSGEMNLTMLGLGSLIGGGGALIGSVKKIKPLDYSFLNTQMENNDRP